ncbi:hypothetical protein D915_001458 [Fasciola hepatica]|uniref:Uncharacterized protein n=1 Tax=Fasciola hepatica TaxID=6192 RepID=A0A4E0RJ89_FASHE|nr:hypothetical protein D915_001458 [Fasciola hepatica]
MDVVKRIAGWKTYQSSKSDTLFVQKSNKTDFLSSNAIFWFGVRMRYVPCHARNPNFWLRATRSLFSGRFKARNRLKWMAISMPVRSFQHKLSFNQCNSLY